MQIHKILQFSFYEIFFINILKSLYDNLIIKMLQAIFFKFLVK